MAFGTHLFSNVERAIPACAQGQVRALRIVILLRKLARPLHTPLAPLARLVLYPSDRHVHHEALVAFGRLHFCRVVGSAGKTGGVVCVGLEGDFTITVHVPYSTL